MLANPRLRLRPPTTADHEAYASLWAPSTGVASGLVNHALDAEAAWSRLLRSLGHWSAFGFGPFLVEDGATGVVAGEVGFNHGR